MLEKGNSHLQIGFALFWQRCGAHCNADIGALQLLGLLTIFDLLQWDAPEVVLSESPKDRLQRYAADLEHAHHFHVLQIHFTAIGPEIETAYLEQVRTYAPNSENHALCPESSGAIRSRIEEAYRCLKDSAARARYRRATFPDYDWSALSELASQRSRSLAMRGEAEEAHRSDEASKDLQKSVRRRPQDPSDL